MRAVVLSKPGASPLSAALRLDPARPVPKPGPGQALVRVVSSAANPVDVYVASGRFGGDNKDKIMAGDLAGVVVECVPPAPQEEGEGEGAAAAAPPAFREGDRVWALTPYFWTVEGGHGCWAEYVVADADWLAPAPPEDALPLADAGAGPLVLCTAWQALEASLGPPLPEGQEQQQDGKEAKERPLVLVTAAAGGVGHAAVQLAKQAWGARVVAVAGQRNRQFCLEALGADEFVDYNDEKGLAAALGEGGEGEGGGESSQKKRFDAAIDMLGGGWTARLARAARKVSHILGRDTDRAALDALQAAPAKRAGDAAGGPAVSIISVTPDGAALARMARMVAAGQLRIEVAARFPLERAGEALEAVSGWHTRGKVVVAVAGGGA